VRQFVPEEGAVAWASDENGRELAGYRETTVRLPDETLHFRARVHQEDHKFGLALLFSFPENRECSSARCLD
jgi:hypothetical protein